LYDICFADKVCQFHNIRQYALWAVLRVIELLLTLL